MGWRNPPSDWADPRDTSEVTMASKTLFWILGTLLATVMSVTGALYAGVNDRLKGLEHDRPTTIQDIAVLKQQVADMSQNVMDIKATASRTEAKVDELLTSLDGLELVDPSQVKTTIRRRR